MQLTRKRKNKGFTLLEIIIVVIIIGVLASLALPRLFSTIEYSRSAEAFANMGSIRGSMERCVLPAGTNNFATNCATLTTLDLSDPSTAPGRHFTYAISAAGVNAYVLTATRNTYETSTGGSTIVFTNTGNRIVRSGTTTFAGVH